ncbi:pentalenolactone synthase [Stackebrandtia albiflava]|uniref:Pentalenolactone synthase n=1 Tax=Stackebrandtia albiflava TaxID=406432 RepID=A0A562VA10_9ACTN|nr:cytochrome P450 [Stackebrandtia albiflava]TWJ14688.1 pentalenolactone synthase [Stackebrandtia albiflava]
MSQTDTAVPTLPFAQPHPLLLPPVLRRLHNTGAVHRVRTATGDTAWLVTGYDRVKALLSDDRLGMSHPDPGNAATISDSALFGGRPAGNFDTEHADRARMRRLLAPFFTAKRMRALEPRVDALVADLMDALSAGPNPADLHEAVALPLPILVICELLGVPYADRAEFRSYSNAAASTTDTATSERGLADLFGYMRRLVEAKRTAPADDVVSGLCAIDGLDDDTVAGLAAMLLFAGHETTVAQIGYATVLLLSNEVQRREVAEDPAKVVGAVEECLRFPGSGTGGLLRYPRVDIDIAGTPIPAGDLVLLDISAANHDPAAFPAPERFDIDRATPTRHLGFSHGGHYCIGAPLARIEMRSTIRALVTRFPTMRLTRPAETLTVHTDRLTRSLTGIPVTW